MNYAKCPFCDMGQAKRVMIFRLTKNLSRNELVKLLKIKTLNFHNTEVFICYKCGLNCGNAGLLAMHMKSPRRKYRYLHRKFDEKI
jgi:hypothetical protein